MDFEKRLEQAIERGTRTRTDKEREAEAAALSAEELKNRHLAARLELTEHIEQVLRKLADHFPGFQYQTVLGSDGWGSRITRDDFNPGRREKNLYSRFEIVVTPHSSANILEATVKGTIHNREQLSKSHYQFLTELDLDGMKEQVDQWALTYAEKFSAA